MSKYKPKRNHPNALRWRKDIENSVVSGIKNGLTIQAVLDSISHMNEAPQSSGALYKIYGPAINEARAEVQGEIGSAFLNKIREGDSKLIEFGMKSFVGWNPTHKIQEVENGEEEMDAVSKLSALLGKNN